LVLAESIQLYLSIAIGLGQAVALEEEKLLSVVFQLPYFFEAKMKINSPNIIGTENIVWLRADGSESLIEIKIGMPYPLDSDWACPLFLNGIDGRLEDIMGVSSIQSLNLALRLAKQRLSYLLESGERLVYAVDKSCAWDLNVLESTFG